MEKVNTDIQALGTRLRKARKMANLQRQELAELADVGITSISVWEHGRKLISERNLKKIVMTLQNEGLEISENWVRFGQGMPPKPKSQVENIKNALSRLNTKPIDELMQFNALFNSAHQATITMQLEHHGFEPFLKKGDYVGGIWIDIASFLGEEICIVRINDKLKVGYVTYSEKEGLFDIEYNISNQSATTLPADKNVNLAAVAPIIRMWR